MGWLGRMSGWVGKSRRGTTVGLLTEDDPAGRTPAHADGPLIEVRPVSLAGAPRNKQEMLEELHRNYREVLELVRKVGAHLDDSSERARRSVELSERTLEVLENLPAALNAPADQRHREQAGALSELIVEHRAASVRAGEALDRLAEHAQHTRAAQEGLAAGVAEFHAGVGGVASAAERTARSMDDLVAQTGHRHEELLASAARTRRWLMLGVSAAALASLGALGIASAALLRAGTITLP